MIRLKRNILILTMLGSCTVMAQNNLNQEVKVIKSYEPIINDAFKISSLPKIVDTIKVTPTFEYDEGELQMYPTKYQPKQLKPAKLVAEPLPKLYYAYVKGGFGSYASPTLNIYTGSQRSEKWLWNVNANYLSSNGKVKNEADKHVYAGLMRAEAGGQVRRIFKKDFVAGITASCGHHANYYYGYDTNLKIAEDSLPLKKKNIEKQSLDYYSFGALVGTTNLDSSKIDFRISANYSGVKTKDSKGDNILHVDAFMSYIMDKEFMGLNMVIDNYSTQGLNIDGKGDISAAVVNFNPWIGAYGRKWRVKVGASTFYDQRNSKFMFFPDISMQYNIIDYFLLPYVEVNGNYDVHSYREMYAENPFVRSDLNINPTKTRWNLAAGFRGNVSSKVAFNIRAEYAKIDNQYLFVNDISTKLHNKFTVAYDEILRTRFLGEISYKMSEKFKLGLKGNYFVYDMSKEIEAWHLPTYTISLDASYNLENKIIARINVYAISNRYARIDHIDPKTGGNLPESKELDGVIDGNLGFEYRITKRFSAFLDLNNIAGQRYYEWNQYANQRFNFMLGLTYTF